MDVFDDHLSRRDRSQDFLADRLLSELFDEVASDRKRDVSLEQGDTHLAHGRAHIASVSAPRPRSRSNTLPSRSLNVSNIQSLQFEQILPRAHGVFPRNSCQTQNTPADETSSAGVHPRVPATMYVRKTRRRLAAQAPEFNPAAACPWRLTRARWAAWTAARPVWSIALRRPPAAAMTKRRTRAAGRDGRARGPGPSAATAAFAAADRLHSLLSAAG